MDLEGFRKKVRDYCRDTGKLQRSLAQSLGLNYSVLSNKLNGTSNARLNQPEVKQITLVLAEWGAFTRQSEVVALLDLGGLKPTSFTLEEWQRPPLVRLENDRQVGVVPVKAVSSPPPTEPVTPVLSTVEPVALPAQASVVGLGIAPTPLIGRQAEVAELTALLQDEQVRLITLVGPGGVGKTRLAGQVAAGMLSYFPQGVFYVRLAPLDDPALVLTAVGDVLMLKEHEGQSLADKLKNWLRDRRLLLVLDNFEQVTKAAGLVADLLANAAGLKILVTSRILLHLEGEYAYEVAPLALPDLPPEGESLPTAAAVLPDMAASPAVQFFVQHGRLARPGFSLTPENALAVAEICRQLNGLPLALELATSRLKIFSPQALLARLRGAEETPRHGDRQSPMLKLLVGGPQNLPARQQTIRQTLDWSYNLLENTERTLFARLSVFASGCSLEAAEEVCNLAGDLGDEVLTGLELLIDKSMLRSRPEPSGELRFSMLQMIREYGLEQLARCGEEELLRARHAAYYLSLAETAEMHTHGPAQVEWMTRLETEQHNMRAALAWLLERGAQDDETAQLAGRLVVALYRFWWLRNYYSEGRRWIESVLAFAARLPRPLLARLYHALGQLMWDQGERDEAIRVYELSLGFWRELEDKQGMCGVLDGLGYATARQGDFARSLEYHRESLALWRELGDQRGVAISLYNQGVARQQSGDYATALQLFEESQELFLEARDSWGLELTMIRLNQMVEQIPQLEAVGAFYEETLAASRRYGDLRETAICLRGLACVYGMQGRHRLAADLYEEALVILRKLGDKRAQARTLDSLAWELLFLGEYERPARLLEEMLRLRVQLGDRIANIYAVFGLSIARARAGQSEEAARLGGLVYCLSNQIRLTVLPDVRTCYDEAMQQARRALGDPVFEQAFQSGSRQTLDQLVGPDDD